MDDVATRVPIAIWVAAALGTGSAHMRAWRAGSTATASQLQRVQAPAYLHELGE